jgi:hypothetical protein
MLLIKIPISYTLPIEYIHPTSNTFCEKNFTMLQYILICQDSIFTLYNIKYVHCKIINSMAAINFSHEEQYYVRYNLQACRSSVTIRSRHLINS